MKNNKKLSDALGSIDEKYIDEYVNGQSVVSRRPMIWRTVIAASVAVTLLVGAVIGIPAALRGNTELGDDTIIEIGEQPIIGDAEREYIIDANGNTVLHIKNQLNLPNDLSNHVHYQASQAEIATENYRETYFPWEENIKLAKKNTSPTNLIFTGIPIAKDTYVFDKEVTVYDDNRIVEYDVASGTTSVKEIPGVETKAPEQKVKRTYFSVLSIKITSILKKNNTTGYEVGDIIHIYLEDSFYLDDNVVEIVIPEANNQPPLPNTTSIPVWRPVPPDTEIAYEVVTEYPLDLTTTAAPAWDGVPGVDTEQGTTAVSTFPETEIAIETAYEGVVTAVAEGTVSVESQGYVPPSVPVVTATEPTTNGNAEENNNNTASHSTERLYIVFKNSNGKSFISDEVKATGLAPEDAWRISDSCTIEEYRTGNFKQ